MFVDELLKVHTKDCLSASILRRSCVGDTILNRDHESVPAWSSVFETHSQIPPPISAPLSTLPRDRQTGDIMARYLLQYRHRRAFSLEIT